MDAMARRVSLAKKQRQLREKLWPHSDDEIWPQPVEPGWCSIPRVMPIILRILGEKGVSGDMDLTRTYLGVWCDNYGQGIVEIANEQTYAETAELRGLRGVRSWRDRMRKLAELGFLRLHEGVGKSIGFVAILHPYPAVERLRQAGLVGDVWWAAFHQRLAQVGVVAESVSEENDPSLE